jgi:metallo-beta-lactamase family protein
MMAYYKSFGGAGEVTGSCHLLTIGKVNILIDCGLFQGIEEELNFVPFGFDPQAIDFLIVTHAHLDHVGRIPLLVKQGFNKSIISTKATATIASLILKNAGGIIESEENPLYRLSDVSPALKHFNKFLEYDQSLTLTEGIQITFKNAGHILGAASVKIEWQEDNQSKSAIFSGDIGQDKRIITSKIDFWEKADYLFVESTYGDSLHEKLEISTSDFKEKILQTLKKQGTVIIPSFALERTQEILYLLRQMSLDGLLKNIPVYLDAPLAIHITEAFLDFPTLFNDEIKNIMQEGENPFSFNELIQTLTKEESMLINENNNPKIIIAGSGMCEGGRVPYHIHKYKDDAKALILFVGYQVNGTFGRKLLSKDSKSTSKIDSVDGFSAHADQQHIIDWINHIENLNCIYLIHGETKKMEIFKKAIKTQLQEKVHIVEMNEQIWI